MNAKKQASILAILVASLAAALCVPSCTSPRTEVIVVVDSNLRGADALDRIDITVTDPTGAVRTSSASLGGANPPLPRTLGLAHTTGPLGPFTIRVDGIVGSSTRVTRSARFTFVANETRVLYLNLLTTCIGTPCGPTMTCGESGCRDVNVAPEELQPWTGVIEGLDGGVMPDTGIPDAPTSDVPSIDAPMPMDVPSVDAPRDTPPLCFDLDGDGFPMGSACDGVVDCNDGNNNIYPGAPERCNGFDDDCNGTIDDGFDTMTDVNHCGGCNLACDQTHSTGGSCVGGNCVLGTCDVGFGDCDTNARTGCETDLSIDGNCGACNVNCTGSEICCLTTTPYSCLRTANCP